MKILTFGLLSFVLLGSSAVRAQDNPAPAPLPDKLDLSAAIRYALDHNYSIRQTREQIRQQDGLIVQVKAQRIPNIAAGGQYQRNQASVTEVFPAETSLWTIQLKATQALYAGGGIKASIRGAELDRDAAVLDLQTTINTSLLDVRTKFYSVLLTREKVKVQEENVELFRRQLQDAQNQFKAGSVSNFEVLRAEVSLANAQPDLITARNDFRIAIEQLRQSLGVPSAPRGITVPFPEVVGTLAYAPQEFEEEAALSLAREHRPELLRFDKLRDAGEQTVRGARSTYYPAVSAFGTYEWLGEGLAQGGNYNANGWLFGLQSSWAIFDGRATTGRVMQAKSQLEQTRLSRSSAELAIDVEVRQALSTLQESAELVGASQKTVGEATEALRLANERYHAGSATQLDVLTSQVSLTQARTNVLQADYNYSVALAAMNKAIGASDALVGN